MKKNKKNEDEPKEDEEGNPIEWLLPSERAIWNALLAGEKAPQEHVLNCVNEYIKSPAATTKGFVLDIPLNAIECFDKLKPEFEEEEIDEPPPKPEGEEGEEQKEEEKPEENEEDEEKKKKKEKPVEPPLPSPDF